MQQQSVTQQQFVTQQPTVTVVTQNAQPSDDKFKPSALSQMRGLSIMQLVMGSLCVVFGIILLAIETSEPYHGSQGLAYVSYGIWIGLYFILLGGIGLGAVNSNTSCWIISSMVLNIISSCSFWLFLLIFASIGIGTTEDSRCTDYLFFKFCDSSSVASAFLALDSLMLIMAVIELVISIWTAALCCGAVCRCCKGSQGHVISYNAQPQTQAHIMVIPSVPTTAYGQVYSNTVQVGGQTQYTAQPVGVHQQPVGFSPPQGPPSYYSASQPAENPAYEQPPPTAQPTKY